MSYMMRLVSSCRFPVGIDVATGCIHQDIEGDELYTKVDKTVFPPVSKGWTIALFEIRDILDTVTVNSISSLTIILHGIGYSH